MPDAKTLSKHYPKDYYSYNASPEEAPARKGPKWKHYLRHPFQAANALVYSKWIGQNKDVRGRTGLKFLDVGCGDGAYLVTKKAEGCECYGVDISVEALSKLKKKHPDIRTHCGELADARWPSDYFDVVNLCHVLEHVPDPEATLREIRRILKPGGLVKISVPNSDSWSRSLFFKCWLGYDSPRHLWVFSRRNLSILFIRTGFRLSEFRTLENSFSVLGSVIYTVNAQMKRKGELMSLRSIWDNEFLKLLVGPYALAANAAQKGDVAEYLLKKG